MQTIAPRIRKRIFGRVERAQKSYQNLLPPLRFAQGRVGESVIPNAVACPERSEGRNLVGGERDPSRANFVGA